jgi:hypothetical protein
VDLATTRALSAVRKLINTIRADLVNAGGGLRVRVNQRGDDVDITVVNLGPSTLVAGSLDVVIHPD